MNLRVQFPIVTILLFFICIQANAFSSEVNDPKSLVFTTDNILMQAGKDYSVDIYANAKVYGYQYTLNFDKEQVEFIRLDEGLVLESNLGFTKLNEGAITCSWNMGEPMDLKEKVLFTLHFKAKKNVLLSEVLSINSRYTKAEAYSEDLEIMTVELDFSGASSSTNFRLYQNNPNPFKGVTFIDFDLPQNETITLVIQDVNGKVIRTIKGAYDEGFNRVEIKDLNASGVLYYTLEAGELKATRKMVIID
jgi:hypothetical protein